MSRQHKRFAKLRNILEEAPSEDTWKKLCKQMERIKPEDWESIVEPWLQSHLEEEWPDKLRVFPRRWLNQLKEGVTPQGISLVTFLEWQGSITEKKLEQWFGQAELPSLRTVDFNQKSISRKALKKFVNMPAFSAVKHFHLGSANFGAAGVRDLLTSAFLPQLETLSIASTIFKDNDKLKLPESVSSTNLKALDLSSTDMTEEIWQSWKQADLWSSVEKLTIGTVFHPIPYFSASDTEWAPNLKELELVAASTESLQASGLVDSPLAQELRHLTLSVTQTPMGRPVFRLLEQLPELESFLYRWDDFSDISETRLEDWSHPSLKHLHLQFIKMKPTQTEALLRSPLTRQLEVLELGLGRKLQKMKGWEELKSDNPTLRVY